MSTNDVRSSRHAMRLFAITTAVAALALGLPIGLGAGADSFERFERRDRFSGTWEAAPIFALGAPTFPTLSNQTVRETARISVGGRRLRVRLSNETSSGEIVVGAARVALATTAGGINPGSDRVLTFGGRTSVTLRAGAPALSDPVDLRVHDLDTLAVSIFLPNSTTPIPGHLTATSTTFASAPGSGDVTGATLFPTAVTATASFLLSRIDVVADDVEGVIVTLGDSITDGFQSTVDANRRWPDVLAERLKRQFSLRFGVVNAGISGNRVLHDQPLAQFGPNALARFDRDVVAVPGVSHVVLLEGINDIGLSGVLGGIQSVTADEIVDGYQQIIARAHEHGITIVGGTLTPFAVATTPGYFTAAGETTRQAINAFIRTSGAFDGVIDFDAAIRDPADLTKIRAAFDSGDHLHPNDAGYRAMAEAIDLKLFRR